MNVAMRSLMRKVLRVTALLLTTSLLGGVFLGYVHMVHMAGGSDAVKHAQHVHHDSAMPGMVMEHDASVCPQTLMDGLCTVTHGVAFTALEYVYAFSGKLVTPLAYVSLFEVLLVYALLVRYELYGLRLRMWRRHEMHIELFSRGVLHGKAF